MKNWLGALSFAGELRKSSIFQGRILSFYGEFGIIASLEKRVARNGRQERGICVKIGFLGDSITYGYGLANRERDRYATLVCRKLGCEEINLGITGTLVARAGLSRDDGTAFVDRLPLLEGCDRAVVFGGTNDYFWSDGPLDGEELDCFAPAADFLCRELLRRFPRERILMITPYPHHGVGNFQGGASWRDACEHDTDAPNYQGCSLADYASAIAGAAETYGLNTLNLFEARPGFDWRAQTLDGCHPNEDGHRWLAESPM